jgi:hypothetical protein
MCMELLGMHFYWKLLVPCMASQYFFLLSEFGDLVINLYFIEPFHVA